MGKPSFSIVGCGKVGITLGKRLVQRGYPVAGLASRSLASARKAAELLGTDRVSETLWEATGQAGVVFITTPDDAIEDACRVIAQHSGFQPEAVVLHCSGVLSSVVLSSARDCGAHVGSLHPLQSFASIQEGTKRFEGILVSVEGDARAKAVARRIVQDLGANYAELQGDAKTLYHAAAVVASNYLVTLMHLAFGLNASAGISAQDSILGLMPLIQGTLSNIKSQGIPNALTGPIARGDVKTVQRHIQEIAARSPEFLQLYKTLGAHTIGLASAKGTVSPDAVGELEKILHE